jgi:hypothetical protein
MADSVACYFSDVTLMAFSGCCMFAIHCRWFEPESVVEVHPGDEPDRREPRDNPQTCHRSRVNRDAETAAHIHTPKLRNPARYT